MIKRIICWFKGHDYHYMVGSQYMCTKCWKVVWKRDYKKYMEKK